MSLFHRHKWEVVGRTYTKPSGWSIEGSGHLIRVAMLGQTTVSLRCTECGDVATREFCGEWTSVRSGSRSEAQS